VWEHSFGGCESTAAASGWGTVAKCRGGAKAKNRPVFTGETRMHGRQDAADAYQRDVESPRAFHHPALRKVGQEVGAFCETSTFRAAIRSGVPLPTRWTFASALLASAHGLFAALRPPGFACFQSPLIGRGTPSLIVSSVWKPGVEATPPAAPTRRQDAAHEYQWENRTGSQWCSARILCCF
jgi:hypothetical protein